MECVDIHVFSTTHSNLHIHKGVYILDQEFILFEAKENEDYCVRQQDHKVRVLNPSVIMHSLLHPGNYVDGAFSSH